MKTTVVTSALLVSFSLFSGQVSANQSYKAKYPPLTLASEINGTKEGTPYHARALVAAARMAAKFYANAQVMTDGIEEALLNACKNQSTPGTAWPEGCNFGGLIKMMNAQPDFGKNWLPLDYPTTSQNMIQQQKAAIDTQLHGLRMFKSPSIVPIYGQVDHWVTIHEIVTDNNGSISVVKFLDACSGLDYAQNSCTDNMWSQANIGNWVLSYYIVIKGPGPFINSSDEYYEHFLTSFDPPVGARGVLPVSSLQPTNLMEVKAAGVLDDDEIMDERIAEARVWDALFLADIDQDEVFWPIIEQGSASAAWKVRGTAPSGAPWDYYLVPLLDESGAAVAFVRLSAMDGAFEQIWVAETPRYFVGVPLEEAAKIAGGLLAPGEKLVGGELAWDARVWHPLVRSPSAPYYSFRAVDRVTGAEHGELIVRLTDGASGALAQSR